MAAAPPPKRARPPVRSGKASARVAAPRAGRSTEAVARPRRDRDATKRRLLDAVAVVLARDGFSAIGVNAVAKEAGVDKVLVYRYFDGLPGMLRAWGESGRFWPRAEDLLGDDPEAFATLPLPERYARFFEHFVDELRARPLTIEILAAEIVARNELTAILETEREEWGRTASRILGAGEFAARPDLQGLTVLLIAGVQYLLIRSRGIRVFGGIDIRSDAGWQELKATVRHMARTVAA